MSARSVNFTFLVCDFCGAEENFGNSRDVTEARIRAAADGWKYRAYVPKRVKDRRGRGGSSKAVRDACRACELPDEVQAS